MNTLLRSLSAVAAAVALAATAEARPLPAASGATVVASDCGTNPQLTVGSSPLSGSILPDVDTIQCRITFPPPTDPFDVIVDGSTDPGDYVAPLCSVQIEGPRTKYTVAVTAAGIHVVWDENISKPVVPPQLVSWVCYYPWIPEGQTNRYLGSRAGSPQRSAR